MATRLNFGNCTYCNNRSSLRCCGSTTFCSQLFAKRSGSDRRCRGVIPNQCNNLQFRIMFSSLFPTATLLLLLLSFETTFVSWLWRHNLGNLMDEFGSATCGASGIPMHASSNEQVGQTSDAIPCANTSTMRNHTLMNSCNLFFHDYI